MPAKYGQLPKSVLDGSEENKLIASKFAVQKVTANDPIYLQFVTVSSKGLFKCNKCNKVWTSHNAFIKVDLVKLCLSEKAENRQGCKRCKLPSMDDWSTPCFKKPWFEEIIERVFMKYDKRKETKGRTKGRSSSSSAGNASPARKPKRKPHPKNLCEKCIKSRKPCWISNNDAM